MPTQLLDLQEIKEDVERNINNETMEAATEQHTPNIEVEKQKVETKTLTAVEEKQKTEKVKKEDPTVGEKDKCVEVKSSLAGEEGESTSLESEADTVTNYLTEVANTNGEISEVGIKWRGEAENVLVAGDFSNWEPLTMSSQGKDHWTGTEH